MATTEELNILLRTTADTSGAQQVSRALQQTQQSGAQAQQQLTAGQQGSNAVLRALMAQHGQTLESFQKASQTVSQSMGTRPTLRPEDFGISPQIAQAALAQTRATDQARTSLARATAGVVEHTAAQGELRQGFQVTGNELVRFGVSALGIGAGLSVAGTAGTLVKDALVAVTTQAIAADQAARNLTATFGAAAAGWRDFAEVQSRAPGGFSVTDIEAATEAVRPLAEQFNLTDVQVKGLVDSAQELANIRNIPLQTALDALLGSLQGNSAAADKLGLSMSDQQVAARAASGAYASTFTTLTDGEKVMLRYIELLKQVDTQQKNVAGSGPSVAQRSRELGVEIGRLNTIIGGGPLEAFLRILTGLSGGLSTTTDKQRALGVELDANGQIIQKNTQDWGDYIRAVQKAQDISGPELTPPPRVFGPAPLQSFDIQGSQVQAAAQQALQTVRGAMGQLAQTSDAQLAVLANRQAEVTALSAAAARQAMQSTGQVTNAITVALARSQDPAEQARLQQQLDLINALTGANESLLQAQRAQNQLQQQGVQLSAQQAAIQLQFLPAQQQQLANERELNRIRLQGQLAALGPQEALEDLRFQQQRDRLIAQNRNLPVEQRIEARRDIRQLARAAPGVELAALDAQRQLTPVDRALARLQIEIGLQQNAMQTALAPVQAMIQQNQLLQQLAAAIVASRQQQVEVIISGAVDVNTNGAGALSDADKQSITDAATAQFADQFHAGLDYAERARSNRLAGAG